MRDTIERRTFQVMPNLKTRRVGKRRVVLDTTDDGSKSVQIINIIYVFYSTTFVREIAVDTAALR